MVGVKVNMNNPQFLGSQTSGDVANFKHPLLIIAKVQLRLRVPVHYCSFLPANLAKVFCG